MFKHFCFFVICLANSLNAQTTNYADHSGRETTFNLVGINNKSYYLTRSTSVPSCCSDGMSIVGIGENGVQLFRTPFAHDPYMNYGDLTSTIESNLLMYAGTKIKGCDYGGARFVVCKMDTLGTVLWKFTTLKFVNSLIPKPDGTFYMYATDSLFHFSTGGQMLSKTSLGFTGANASAIRLKNGNLLFNYGTTSFRFRTTDSQGTLISDIATPWMLSRFTQTSSGEIIGISGSNLLKYSSSFSLLNTSNFSPALNVSAFYYRNDSIFVVGQDTLVRPKYILLDSQFNILHQSATNLEQFWCTGITVDKRNVVKIISWGTNSPGFLSHTFSGFFHTSVNGNLSAKRDVGVIDIGVTVDAIYEYSYYFSGVMKANVKVKNYGMDTVKTFKLNYFSYTSGISYCLLGLNKIYQYKLLPGDSVTVQTGTIAMQPFPKNALNPDGTIDLNICLNTTVPDSENDIDYTNDGKCQLLKGQPVGIRENNINGVRMQLFPNPTDNHISIFCSDPLSKLEVFDLRGKLIFEMDIDGSEFKFQTNDLESGMYFFKIYSEKGSVVKKVLVNH